MHSMLQQRVQQVMDDLVASGEEVGLQVAAYVNGDLVVDAWAGVADEATGRLVDGDTLFTSWSTGKGFVATCQPLGIEGFYLGIPDAVEGRVAPLTEAVTASGTEASPNELMLRVMPPQVTSAAVVNRPDFRRAVIPGGGGIMSARAIARHYAMLAGDGQLDGTRLLSAERCAAIRALQSDAPDIMFGGRTRWGLGYMLGGDPERGGNVEIGPGERAFGHGGNGGSLGYADPVRNLSVGVTKNRMNWPEPRRSAAYAVTEAIRVYLDTAEA